MAKKSKSVVKKAKVKTDRTNNIKAQKEAIDNKIVMATAIALVSSIALAFLYNWVQSTAVNTVLFIISSLMWIGVAGCVGLIGFGIYKKDKKYYFLSIYFAALAICTYLLTAKVIIDIFRLMNLPHHTGYNYLIVFAIIVIYLIATYVYYGIKLHKGFGKK